MGRRWFSLLTASALLLSGCSAAPAGRHQLLGETSIASAPGLCLVRNQDPPILCSDPRSTMWEDLFLLPVCRRSLYSIRMVMAGIIPMETDLSNAAITEMGQISAKSSDSSRMELMRKVRQQRFCSASGRALFLLSVRRAMPRMAASRKQRIPMLPCQADSQQSPR